MLIGRALAGFFGGTQPILRSYISQISLPNMAVLKLRMTLLFASFQAGAFALSPIAGVISQFGLFWPWLGVQATTSYLKMNLISAYILSIIFNIKIYKIQKTTLYGCGFSSVSKITLFCFLALTSKFYSVYWGLQVHQSQFFGTKPKSLQRYIYMYIWISIIFCNIGGGTPTSNDWGLELWVSRLFFCWVLPLFKSVPITAKAFVLHTHTRDVCVFGQPPSTGCTSCSLPLFLLCFLADPPAGGPIEYTLEAIRLASTP